MMETERNAAHQIKTVRGGGLKRESIRMELRLTYRLLGLFDLLGLELKLLQANACTSILTKFTFKTPKALHYPFSMARSLEVHRPNHYDTLQNILADVQMILFGCAVQQGLGHAWGSVALLAT